jgi:hypothetical protein
MAEFLSMDNILTGDEAASLFTDEDTQETQTTPPSEKKEEKETKETKEEDTTEVNPDNLFDEEPESVGSEEN